MKAYLLPINPTGAAGELKNATKRLNDRDGATVSVESIGAGDAGTINVVAIAIACNFLSNLKCP